MRFAVYSKDMLARRWIAECLRTSMEKFDVKDLSEYQTMDNLDKELRADVYILDVDVEIFTDLKLIETLEKNNPDVILLLLLEEKYYKIFHLFKKIFVLKHTYILQSPVQADKFQNIFEHIKSEYSEKQKVKSKKIKQFGKNYLDISKIRYMECGRNNITIVTDAAEYNFRGVLNEIEQELMSDGFVRCHRGFLINLNYLEGISNDLLFLTKGEKIPVSKNLKQYVLDSYKYFNYND